MAARFAELAEALVIPVPEDPVLVLDGCRRLLGPNLYSDSPGAVGDALCPPADRDRMLGLWASHTRALMQALGWQAPLITRPFDGGASLFVAAPADRLMTAAYLVEGAWHFTACEMLGHAAWPFGKMTAELVRIAAMEANPPLLRLLAAADAQGIDRLLDDDAVTLGHGAGAQTFDTGHLPETPDWAALHDIPLALVTGTNGKTTTTRLIAAMGQAAGRIAGLSSTEFVRVGDDILDRGDYSGPAGARLLLRDPRLELGVLEVARGGILRRGLPVTRARAAVVTNVAADHLGQYGIHTVAELALVKMAVRRGLVPGGWLILNAGDAMVVQAAKALGLGPSGSAPGNPPTPSIPTRGRGRAPSGGAGEVPQDGVFAGQVVWFALDPDCAQIRAARASGQPCGWLRDGVLTLSDGRAETALVPAADVPLTLGGAARYNIENALAAALAARALAIPDAAIRATLVAFRSDPADNPGRANEFRVNGARVFVDFAHNPHSIAAVTSALAAVPAQRRFVLVMHAGDRTDDEIRALTTGAFALRPDYVVAAENPKYLRGRSPGAIPALIRQACRDQGLPDRHILSADSPLAGALAITERLRPGDLALLLVHADRDQVFALLEAASR